MDKTTREAQRAIWAGHIEQHRQSGKGVKAFCEEAGLKPWQFFYWRSALYPAKTAGRGFVEVKVKSGGGVVIEVAGCRINVERGFDAELLRDVLVAVRVA